MSYVNFRFSFLGKGKISKLAASPSKFHRPMSQVLSPITKARDLPAQGQEYKNEPKGSGN